MRRASRHLPVFGSSLARLCPIRGGDWVREWFVANARAPLKAWGMEGRRTSG